MARLGLAGVSLVLLLAPLALPLPGLPTHLKADEGAYYGMAMSLAHDGDLRLDTGDVDRFFAEFPYRPVNNVILMTRDGWHTVHYGKPWVYSLFAAPFVRLLGGEGLFFANALLLVGMIWMGAAHLRRHNGEGIAALFATGFFLLSLALAYTTWMQPEVFNMAAIAACLYLGMPRDEEEGLPRPRRDLALAALSGAALALAVYNKPMVALVGLAPLAGMLRRRRLRAAGAWLAGAAACVALLAGLSVLLTGTPSSYLGVRRGGFTLCGPGQMPVTPEAAAVVPVVPAPEPAPTLEAATPEPAASPAFAEAGRAAAAAAASSPTGNTFSWLLRLPDTSPSEFAQNVGYFLWGRHTGLLLYTPFAALAVLLFLLHGRRSVERWVLLAALAAVGLFFLLQIAWNWQGGGGFVGNRYFVNVYPAFLFLVTRVRPPALLAAGFTAGGLFLTPLLASPFGMPVVEPTLQAHVRGRPFRAFPLELTLRNVPGYHRVPVAGVRAIGRRDVMLPMGDTLWLHGATPVEIWLVRHQATPGPSEPLPRGVWELHSPAPRNAVEVRFGGFEQTFDLGEGQRVQLELPQREPDREWTIFCPEGVAGEPGSGRPRCPVSAWRLEVRSARGRATVWTRDQPPSSCAGWPHNPRVEESFYLGTELTWLGEGPDLAADVFAVDWLRVVAPPRVAAGSDFPVRVALVNRSTAAWPERGGARVRLSYHWLDPAGGEVVREGARTELSRRVEAGETLRLQQTVEAPPEPGRYVLELDPVFERVAWFSDRGARTARVPVEVVAVEGGAPATVPAPEPAADEAAETGEDGT